MKTYYTNGIATLMRVDGGVKALYDDEGLLQWGEFISDDDFNESEFNTVDFGEVDFTNIDPYYQREMTQDIYLLSQSN